MTLQEMAIFSLTNSDLANALVKAVSMANKNKQTKIAPEKEVHILRLALCLSGIENVDVIDFEIVKAVGKRLGLTAETLFNTAIERVQ